MCRFHVPWKETPPTMQLVQCNPTWIAPNVVADLMRSREVELNALVTRLNEQLSNDSRRCVVWPDGQGGLYMQLAYRAEMVAVTKTRSSVRTIRMLVGWLCQCSVVRNVILPTIADMVTEHDAAIAASKTWLSRWIVVLGCASLVKAIAFQAWDSTAGRLIRAVIGRA